MITAEIFVKPRRRISDIGQVPETDMIPLLEEQLRVLRNVQVSDISNVDEIVLNSRKTVKKIRALLLFIRNFIPRNTYDEIINSIASVSKELAPIRECAVLKETCSLYKHVILANAGGMEYSALEHLLDDQHKQLLHEKFVEKDTFRIIRSNLNNLRIFEIVPAIYMDNQQIKTFAGKTFKKCQKQFNNLSVASSSKQYHQFRKCSKTLQYQLGFMYQAGLGRSQSKNKLDQINHLLGRKNDLNIFVKYLRANLKDVHRQTSPALKKEIKSLRRKILKEGREYY